MALDKALLNLKWDRRMIEKNLQNGTLTKEEYEKMLKELPDMAENIDLINIDREDDDEMH